MSEELNPHPDAPFEPKAIIKALAAWSNPYRVRIWYRLKIMGLWVGIAVTVAFRYFKARVGLVVHSANAFTGGYRHVTAAEFLTMYPPNKNCKQCFTKGFITIMDPETKRKRLEICHCAQKAYLASGKKYIVRGIE